MNENDAMPGAPEPQLIQIVEGIAMVNPFTVQVRIHNIQQDVLGPLYTLQQGYAQQDHSWLLVETGRAIARHQHYIEELCASPLVSAAFHIIKFFGGAGQLTREDFRRFTSYVNDGGIRAMVKMLLSVNKEKTFIEELRTLPLHVQNNAAKMLEKSCALHTDFISGYLQENYGAVKNSPAKILDNFEKSKRFITTLARLAAENVPDTR